MDTYPCNWKTNTRCPLYSVCMDIILAQLIVHTLGHYFNLVMLEYNILCVCMDIILAQLIVHT